jgi:hypothetical protein
VPPNRSDATWTSEKGFESERKLLVGRDRIELSTQGFSVQRQPG